MAIKKNSIRHLQNAKKMLKDIPIERNIYRASRNLRIKKIALHPDLGGVKLSKKQ